MSQVSRRFLNKKVQERIFSLFISSITLSNTSELTGSFIEDLFTPTERIMLAKRFSIAYLLLRGYSYDMICESLKVSRTTVGHVALWLGEKGKGFREIIEKIKRHESMKKILSELQDALDDYISSLRGQNWSQSKRWLWQRRLERQKPY